MQVVLIPSVVGNASPVQSQYLSSYLLNGSVAIDAGGLGLFLSAHEQSNIKHVFLTHTHIDHIASLPIFVENAYDGDQNCVTIYGSREVLECLRSDVFNGRIWPDFIGMSSTQTPLLNLQELRPFEPVEAEGLRIVPIPVNHIVPTLGFLVEEHGRTIVIPSDTGPTEAIWNRANAAADVRAVFLEATFPNVLNWLAMASKHMTPALYRQEIAKLQRPTDVIAVHIKARFRKEVETELHALDLPRMTIGRFGEVYEF